MASTRWILVSAGVVLIVLGMILGVYGSKNAKYVTERIPTVIKGVPIRYVTESVWTPSPVYWLGMVLIAAGLISLVCAAFVKGKKVAPEIPRRVLEPIPA